MRIVIALVLAAAAGWSAYWLYGSRSLDAAIREGIRSMRENGVEVEVGEIAVSGYPNRFDTTFDAPRLTWPSGIGWSAPFLQVFALSYRPNQLIVAFPQTQELSGRFGTVEVRAERARASALFRTDAERTFDHGNLVADRVRISLGGREASAARLLAAARVPEGADANRQNVGVTIDDLNLPRDLASRLGGSERALVDGATLDATLLLSQPMTADAAENGTVSIRRIEIARLHVDWSDMALGVNGAVDVARDGSLDGTLDLSVTNWKRALEIAEQSGLVPPKHWRLIERGAAAIAAMGDRDDRLEMPLGLRAGQIWLGPVAIGPAPRF